MEKTAWLVDDDEDIREAMSMMLRIMGYQVNTFSEARPPAHALLSGKRPDVLFLDINMPYVNGIELLKFIRKRGTWKDLTILMVTSECDELMVEEAIRLGADGYVFKPVNFEELANAIQNAIKRRRIVTGPLKPLPPESP